MIDFILRPFRRNFGKDKRFYAAIDDMFGFIPNNIELYKVALIHKSASVATEDGRQLNNERLEYLGDAVIESVTSDYLFIEFPDKDEGFLTQLRSKMVSRQTLNDVAKRIGLDDYVISHTSNNVSQKHIYGDAFEAMMGAIYLDQGYDFVNRLLINKIFVDYIKVDDLTEAETDFKSRLIEWCQKNHHTIRFSTHNDRYFSSTHPSFYSKVLIDNIEVGYGVGDSKKEAEQRAASSVAHGVSDDDCTKLMDKLDVLEAQQLRLSGDAAMPKQVVEKPKKSQPQRRNEAVENDVKPTEVKVEVAGVASAEKEAVAAEEKSENVVKTRGNSPRKKSAPAVANEATAETPAVAKTERKRKPKAPAKSVAEVTENEVEKGVEDNTPSKGNGESKDGAENVAPQKSVKRVRRSRNARPAKSDKEVVKGPVTEGVTETATEDVKEGVKESATEDAKGGTKRPARRRAKSSANSAKKDNIVTTDEKSA